MTSGSSSNISSSMIREGIPIDVSAFNKDNYNRFNKMYSQHLEYINNFEQNKYKIKWKIFSLMPEAIDILKNNIDNIDWISLSENTGAIDLLEKNLDKLDKFWFSTNPVAIPILEKHPEMIDWSGLLLNRNPNAYDLFEKNIDKVDWIYVSCYFLPNKTIDKLIMEYRDKVNWLWRDLAQAYRVYSETTVYIFKKLSERVINVVLTV